MELEKKIVIIFEGIASSGKTTLEQIVSLALPESVIVDESHTLMPLIDNRDPGAASAHLLRLLDEIQKMPDQLIILDRFHFTHAFRTNTDLAPFNLIEKKLQELFRPYVIFLSIREGLIEARIRESIEHRGESWGKGKQGTVEEKTVYYINQQRKLDFLMKESKLPILFFDTSDKYWEVFAASIVSEIQAGGAY